MIWGPIPREVLTVRIPDFPLGIKVEVFVIIGVLIVLYVIGKINERKNK